MDWGQTIATIASVLAVGVGLLAYITRQFNRIGDQLSRLDNRVQNVEIEQVRFNERFDRIDDQFARVGDRFSQIDQRFDRIDGRLDSLALEMRQIREDLQNLEIEQARMLGFLEGRGITGKAAAATERAT